jgi:hypothetical protein
MVTARRNVVFAVVDRLLETETNEVVASDETLGLGRVLAALDWVTEQ